MMNVEIGKLYRIKSSMRGAFAFEATPETEYITEEKTCNGIPQCIPAKSTHGPHDLHGKVVLVLTKECILEFHNLIEHEFVKALHVNELIWISINALEEIDPSNT